jgi:hypothetical protein
VPATEDSSNEWCGRYCLNYLISQHAREEMLRRSIPLELLDQVLSEPQQIIAGRGNLKAYQSQVDFGGGKMFLLRVIVDDTLNPAIIITVYRTSKIGKYWRTI